MKFIPSKKHLLIAVGAIFILLCFSYGAVKYVLPNILVKQYKSQINDAFDTSFTPELNQHVQKLGIPLTSKQPTECDNGPYSPSSPCSRYIASERIKVDSTQIEKWDKYSKDLDTYLVRKGWVRQEGIKLTSFTSLLNPTDDTSQAFATYERHQHGVTCYMSADYIENIPYGTVSIDEGCSKYTSSPSEWFN